MCNASFYQSTAVLIAGLFGATGTVAVESRHDPSDFWPLIWNWAYV